MARKTKTAPAIFIHQLAWGNPYTSPPDGLPRLRAEIAADGPRTPQALADYMAAVGSTPGDGWSLIIRYRSAPARQMTPEAKASMRRKRLQRRMDEKYPLLAEQFVAEKIDAQPGYYIDGISDGDEERVRILAEERAYYERMSANVGRLFVYDPARPTDGQAAQEQEPA